ncbi:hypothetical protein J1N35_041387 [Gossypium stocksii]|uniref:Uncharacterized protein n=1 Tax=Gossypium stocksii TaxID=47602 RepID=A0A9D3ZJN3_9ROSI|nr:hypothetical protein J1N35_041387 [Gossypium stocksii]
MSNISSVGIIEPLMKFHFEYDEEDGLQTVLHMNLNLNTIDKPGELMTCKESIHETVVFMEAPQFPKSQGTRTARSNEVFRRRHGWATREQEEQPPSTVDERLHRIEACLEPMEASISSILNML